ncbi:uroporphyrinogen decarboxylase family protein, partial [Serratia sp. CY66905]|uniref:uroporphyrinogen decarboxylase family protein n=1 Tax=Serratia sp. CY66905 TaxID=3383661 RepID=UPI003FA0555F
HQRRFRDIFEAVERPQPAQQAIDKVALQGNMDPSMLYASPARIAEEVETILAGFGHGNGHVFNLGHGIHQDVPPEHAGAFVEAVHAHSAKYHR